MTEIFKYIGVFYVQVTVHRDKLRIEQPTRCIKYPKLYFVIKQSSNLTLLGSGHITCMKQTNCRVYSR
jgi:hypothetical protein